MMLLLAGLLPVCFVAGLLLRPSTPTVDNSAQDVFVAASFPPESAESPVSSQTLVVDQIEVAADLLQSGSGEAMLRLQPAEAFPFANVLVYWMPSVIEAETVSEDAILLGSLSGTSQRQFALPKSSGALLFYSLGQQAAIASVPLSF